MNAVYPRTFADSGFPFAFLRLCVKHFWFSSFPGFYFQLGPLSFPQSRDPQAGHSRKAGFLLLVILSIEIMK